MISLPDINVLDLVLTQLRTNAVAVSFLHVGSQFHPHCAQGLVPYSELMQFISCATFGTYIPLSNTSVSITCITVYQLIKVFWNFKKFQQTFILTLHPIWIMHFLQLINFKTNVTDAKQIDRTSWYRTNYFCMPYTFCQ